MKAEQGDHSGYPWEPITDQLPSEADFGTGLDERSAWRQFGGLSLDEAYAHFLENPDSYQEDFMFMGAAAFAYYFPVIERYLFSVQAEDEWDDCSAWILGCGMELQWESGAIPKGSTLSRRVAAIAEYVLSHVSQYSMTPDGRGRTKSSWDALQARLNESGSRNEPGP